MFDEEILKLSQRLGVVLSERQANVTTAESCTGGLIAAAITAVPGSSGWFHGGYISYDNEIKRTVLGVRAGTLRQEGAVSELTVREMAQGALTTMSAHWAIAVSGIAGPGGEVPGKPVGTVCFGLAHRNIAGEVSTLATTRLLPGDRTEVRLASVELALRWLLQAIEAEPILA